MPYSTEDNLQLLIASIQCGDLSTDFAEVAKRLGLTSERSAKERVKALIRINLDGKGEKAGRSGQGLSLGTKRAPKAEMDEESPKKRAKKVQAPVKVERDGGDHDAKVVKDEAELDI